jgi:hypothetical protein
MSFLLNVGCDLKGGKKEVACKIRDRNHEVLFVLP